VKELAKQRGVTIKNHNVIYKLVDDIKEEITKRLPTKQVEESLGSF
jgi:translation initiation factor IF-2